MVAGGSIVREVSNSGEKRGGDTCRLLANQHRHHGRRLSCTGAWKGSAARANRSTCARYSFAQWRSWNVSSFIVTWLLVVSTGRRHSGALHWMSFGIEALLSPDARSSSGCCAPNSVATRGTFVHAALRSRGGTTHSRRQKAFAVCRGR